MHLKTNINLEVDVEFDILDPLDGPDIPLQVDITGVFVKVPSSQNKARRVNILSALSESEVLAVEDDILTPEFIDNYFRVKAWRSSHE
jgi:hypothetical protein